MILSITSNGENVIRLIGHSREGRELYFLHEERFLLVTLLGFFSILVHIIEEDVVVDTGRGEAHVVFEPANTANAVGVADVLHGVLTSVEVVNVDLLSGLTGSACEQVTTVRESDFTAAFDY